MATRKAEEDVCHITSRALLNLTPGTAQDWPATIIIAKFDAWAQRGASVVWSDRAVQHYDQWPDTDPGHHQWVETSRHLADELARIESALWSARPTSADATTLVDSLAGWTAA